MPASSSSPAIGDPLVSCVSLDFRTKEHKRISVDDTQPAMYAGQFVWIDIDIAQTDEARTLLNKLGLCAPEIIEDALSREPATQIARYDDYIHLVLSGCRLQGHKFDLERVDAIMGESFLLTLHKGQPVFLEAVRKSYVKDFQRFAKSPSFLLYELWDHLIDNYLGVHKKFEERVEAVQVRLQGDVDDTVLQDVLVDRDILNGALNNYMSMVAHKTNAVMSRLTTVSFIFLPLTFLCGVYGMNFDVLPEKHFKYGYLMFWVVVVMIAVGIIAYMKRKKWF
jgi:magnesium transporter